MITNTKARAANRKARFAMFIREQYKSQADYIEQTGADQSEVSSLTNVNSSRSFGENKARSIEEDNGLPVGWLDIPIDQPADLPPPPVRKTLVSSATDLAAETAAEMRMLTVYRLANKSGRNVIDSAVENVSLTINLARLGNKGKS
jgi:hypothetical protein